MNALKYRGQASFEVEERRRAGVANVLTPENPLVRWVETGGAGRDTSP